MAPNWKALNNEVFAGELDISSASPASGGDICESFDVSTQNGIRYFVKFHPETALLEAEFRNLQLLAPSPIATPTPIHCVPLNGGAALVLEYLAFGGYGDEQQLGQQLARVHQMLEPGGRYGLDYDNYIGHSPQRNQWETDWADFWWRYRLEPQLDRAASQGYRLPVSSERLQEKVTALLQSHKPPASLLHGDLWGGNKSYLDDGRPVIFDPACYYGDRETDIAFTRVFGGFSPAFYQGYFDEWALPDGWEERESVYNLYHLLNHLNLFGGGYTGSVNALIERIV